MILVSRFALPSEGATTVSSANALRMNDCQPGGNLKVSIVERVDAPNVIGLHGRNDLQIEDIAALHGTTCRTRRPGQARNSPMIWTASAGVVGVATRFGLVITE